jgi:hypothetical protein
MQDIKACVSYYSFQNIFPVFICTEMISNLSEDLTQRRNCMKQYDTEWGGPGGFPDEDGSYKVYVLAHIAHERLRYCHARGQIDTQTYLKVRKMTNSRQPDMVNLAITLIEEFEKRDKVIIYG